MCVRACECEHAPTRWPSCFRNPASGWGRKLLHSATFRILRPGSCFAWSLWAPCPRAPPWQPGLWQQRPTRVRCAQSEAEVDFVCLQVTLASVCSPTEETLATGRAVNLPLRTIAADDIKQLLAHLVTTLAELHRHHRHDPTGCWKPTAGWAQRLPGRTRISWSESTWKSPFREPRPDAYTYVVTFKLSLSYRHNLLEGLFRLSISK